MRIIKGAMIRLSAQAVSWLLITAIMPFDLDVLCKRRSQQEKRS